EIHYDTISQNFSHASILTRNLNDVKVPLEGNYSIYKIPKKNNFYGYHKLDFTRDIDILSNDSLEKFFGNYNYDVINTSNQKWNKYLKIKTGTFDTEKTDTLFTTYEGMSNDIYLIVTEFVSPDNDTIFSFRYFKLNKDESPKYGFMSLQCDKNNYIIGDVMKVNIHSDFKEECMVYVYFKYDNGKINCKQI